MKKTITLMLLAFMAFVLCACGSTLYKPEEKSVQTKTKGESKNKEDYRQPEKKAEELDTKDFSNLSKAAEQVGFSFHAVEKFKNDYSFQSFSVVDAQDKDENGNEIGEVYKKLVLNYQNTYKKLTVTIYPKEEEIKAPPTYVSTKEIEGIDVSLTEYILRLVNKDYKLTKKDKKLIEKGNIGFSCDGVTIGDVYLRGMYWQEDGLYYELKAGTENMPAEELETMAAEIIDG